MAGFFSRILGLDAPSLASIPRERFHAEQLIERRFSIEQALESNPGNARLWTQLGHALLEIDHVDEAIAGFERALAINPERSDALNGLANALRSQGRLEDAIKLYRRAVDIDPANREAFQNLLFGLLCLEGASEEEILGWHRRFAERFEKPLPSGAAHPNSKDPERRLKIAYLSPDLRKHVVGYCMQPIVERHDRGQFEIHCYFNGAAADRLTAELKQCADKWRDVVQLSDEQFCSAVREDGIDVLVELSGHTPGNRLTALARKPAPVQVSYLDYSATTGMGSIDYRLTDGVCDPLGSADPYYTETLVRLPGTYLLYNPPALGEPRKLERGGRRIVLACVNSFYRVSAQAMTCWAEIMNRLPGSELVLIGVPEGDTEKRIRGRYGSAGIAPERIHLFGYLDYERYIELVRAADIALAPFPYNGAMSTLDCLWHGTPVVCRQGGNTFHSRMGQSILSAVGLQDLVAADVPAYVEKVLQLASQRERRRDLRTSLRTRVRGSPLQDFNGFVRSLEAEYRAMWRSYCARGNLMSS
jgi:protein O-GlcNAc transferase